MSQLYEHRLKSGDTIIFKTDMEKDKVQSLPIFSNQYEFIKYFREKGNTLEINIIMKNFID